MSFRLRSLSLLIGTFAGCAPTHQPAPADNLRAQSSAPTTHNDWSTELAKFGPERRAVAEHILKHANVPNDVEFADWIGPISFPVTPEIECDRAVHIMYRTRNDVGALVLQQATYYLMGNQIQTWSPGEDERDFRERFQKKLKL